MTSSRSLAAVLALAVSALLITMMASGCGAIPASGDYAAQPTVLPITPQTPGIPSSVHAEDSVEVQLDTDAVKLDDLFDLVSKDDFLFANVVRNGQVAWLTIQLPGGHVYGDGYTPRPNVEAIALQRYSVRAEYGASGIPDKLFIYDWQENREQEIPANGHLGEADLSDSCIVWSQFQDGRGSIVGYDVKTKKIFPVTSGKDQLYYVEHPRISGDWVGYVVRMYTQTLKADLYVYNLVTSETLHLGTVPYYDPTGWEPYVMSNNRVAWIERDFETGINTVHTYDLGTRQDRVVNDTQSKCASVGVEWAGDLITWACAGHRYEFDLARDMRIELPLFPPQVAGQIHSSRALFSGKWLIWIIRTRNNPTGPSRLFIMPIIH